MSLQPLLWLCDDRRGISGSRDVSLTIFITSMSGRKNLACFTYRFFHFSRPPGLRLTFDAAERNGKFGRIHCQRSKESSSRGKRKRVIFLCRSTVKAEVKSKVIPTNFMKIEGRAEKEEQLVDVIGNQTPSPEAPPRSKKRGRKGDFRRKGTTREAMQKSCGVEVIEREKSEEMTQLKNLFPTLVKSSF